MSFRRTQHPEHLFYLLDVLVYFAEFVKINILHRSDANHVRHLLLILQKSEKLLMLLILNLILLLFFLVDFAALMLLQDDLVQTLRYCRLLLQSISEIIIVLVFVDGRIPDLFQTI